MIKVNPRMITLARVSKGLTLSELGKRLKFTPQAAWQLEQNYKSMNPVMLDSLSKTLHYPSSFFLQRGESLPLPLSYRRRAKVPARVISQIDAIVNIYRLNLEDLISLISLAQPNIPTLETNQDYSPQQCARRLRDIWHVPKGPVENVSELLESKDILLLSYPFETDHVDGKCTIAAEKFPVIVTNHSQLGDRQRFTLAYHLGYLVMHWRTSPDFSRDLSHEAKLFAAEFLMPEKDIKADFENLTFASLGNLKRKWKCSMISLLHRSEDIGMTTPNQKRYIMQQFNLSGIKKREPLELDVSVERYRRVRDMITKFKASRKMNVQQLAEYFHLHVDDFLHRYNFEK